MASPLATSLLVLSGILSAASAVRAQTIPDTVEQEVLIKSSLMSFNDANVTNNYSVFHAKLAKPFRDQFSPDKLQVTFKSFIDGHIDFAFVVAKPPILDEEVKVDDSGVLKIASHFDTMPSQIRYKLKYIRSEAEWKIVGIDVKIGAPPVKEEPSKINAGSGAVKFGN